MPKLVPVPPAPVYQVTTAPVPPTPATDKFVVPPAHIGFTVAETVPTDGNVFTVMVIEDSTAGVHVPVTLA